MAVNNSSLPCDSSADRLYRHPTLYDAVWGYRDFDREARGILELASAFIEGDVRTYCDLACGPGHHVAAMADLGIVAHGADAQGALIDYAKALHAHCKFHVINLTSELPLSGLDLITCLWDAFSEVTTNKDALASLRATRGSLRAGGIFVMQLTHLGNIFYSAGRTATGRWKSAIEDHTLSISMRTSHVDIVNETRLDTVQIECDYGCEEHALTMRTPKRIWLPSSIRGLAHEAGLELMQCYSELCERKPFTLADGDTFVAVFRANER